MKILANFIKLKTPCLYYKLTFKSFIVFKKLKEKLELLVLHFKNQ